MGKQLLLNFIENNIILTEMRNCGQTLCFQLQRQCPEQQPPARQPPKNNQLSQFYSKVSETLQVELKRQHDMHTREVDELNSQIFNLKNTVLRLQMRNQKDLQAEKELRRQYNLLLQKLKQSEPQIISKVEVVQKIKQIPVEIDNNQLLQKQISYWKNKSNELNLQYQKVRADKDILDQENENLREELNRSKRYAETLKDKLAVLTKTVQEKDQLIKKMHLQIDYLKNNKEVVIHTKHLFPQFRQPEKVRTQTKIQTVYAQKPVQKLVFVDVVKKVKQFVQPERAVVNRVISCEEKPQCDCEQNQNRLQFYKNENYYLSGLVQKLESNVNSYKAERQNLVKVIGQKNSELNYLQTKMKLFGGLSQAQPSYNKAGSSVNVTVSKIKQQKPASRNVSVTHQKPTSKK